MDSIDIHKARNLVQIVISHLDINDDEFAENYLKDVIKVLQAERDDMKEMAAKMADAHFGEVYKKLVQLCPDLKEGTAKLPQRIRDIE